MYRRARNVTATLAALALTGCLGTAPHGTESSYFEPESRTAPSNATVIRGSVLRSGGQLLDALVSRVSNMRVRRSSTFGDCPVISIRGQKRLMGPSEPLVYVDGTRAVNTCILNQMRADDVDRVEVYPMGVTSRPGYQSHAHGLVLVFSRRAGS